MNQKFTSLTIEKRFCLCTIVLCVFGVLFLPQTMLRAQTYAPNIYYTFDGPNPLSDSVSNSSLNPNYYSSYYTIGNNSAGQGVGRFLTLYPNSTIIKGAEFTPDSALTIEFLLRPGYQFDGQNIMWSQNGCFSIRMGYPYIQFSTSAFTTANVAVDDVFKIDLTDIGRKSYGYYIDGNWHHLVFKYNAKTGIKQIWVDGQRPTGFQKTITTNCLMKAGTYNSLYLNNNNSYLNYRGDIDEIAAYKYDLHQNVIYNHYLNFLNNLHYSYLYSSVNPPAAASVTTGIDPLEFAPGHPSVTLSVMDQFNTFPDPRFRPGHNLLPNGTLLNYAYLGGYYFSGVTNAQAVKNSVDIQKILFKNFNFPIQVAGALTEWAQFGDTTKFSGAWIKLANENPTVPTTVSTAWPHVIPQMAGYTSYETYTTCQCLPANSYLRNSANQFIDLDGNVTTSKVLSPVTPLDSIYVDGRTQRFYLDKLFKKLNRPLNYILDESENLRTMNTSHVGPGMDPAVLANKNASGMDWNTYFGNKHARLVRTYRDTMMSLPQLANTAYQLYETEGHDFYRPKYTESRLNQTPINGKIYPNASMYSRWPNNWRFNSGAWNGWQWFVESRVNEIAAGDAYCAPAVAAGWDANEELNIRPGQWLGMCKAYAMAGSEFFYPSFFVLNVGTAQIQDPKNYAWQMVIPAYAQSITSRYEDLFKNGYLMSGDVPLVATNPSGIKGYSFQAGDQRKLVVIRKSNIANRYAITGTIQPNSNMMGSTELIGNAQILLDGQVLKFKVRRQGSTYIYDNTVPSAPVFYMLDGWHEYSHPSNWSKNIEFEAELFDVNNSNIAIKTQVPAGTANGDFTNFTSYISFNGNNVQAKYNFNVRSLTTPTYYFWVRARVKAGSGQIDVILDNVSSGSIKCIADTNWVWYRINSNNNLPIIFSNISIANHQLTLTSSNSNVEIDRIILSQTSGAVYGNVATTCTPLVATITSSGPTTFCSGDSVVLTSNNAMTSYLWSNGATTRTVTIKSAGIYTVTITNSAGTTATASSVNIIVNALPVASITSIKNTYCPGDSIELTVSTGASYLWSNGATTRKIIVTATGNYTATVTNTSGCTKSSLPFQIISGSCAPTAVITVNGNTTFCEGDSCILNGTPGMSTYLWSNGATSSSIVVKKSGMFMVTVSNSFGFSAVSAAVSITKNNTPTAQIIASTDSLCPGQTVTLSNDPAAIYLWSNGATTVSTVVNTAGLYTVTVTNNKGCSKISAPFMVRAGSCFPPFIASITPLGATTFCIGKSVVLSATTAVTYLWSTGATTKTITATTSGNYIVTVTNANGQVATASIPVNVLAAPNVSISSSGTDSVCEGYPITLTATGGNSYLWSTGDNTASELILYSGLYTVTVSNTNGCSSTATFNVKDKFCIPDGTVSLYGSPVFCDGDSCVLAALPGMASYLWSTGATTSVVAIKNTSTVTLTVTNVNGYVSQSYPIDIIENPLPVPVISASKDSLCPGSSVTLTSTAAVDYYWSTGENGQSITVNTPDYYSLFVVNSYGCVGAAHFNLVTGGCALPDATLPVSGTINLCDGTPLVVNAKPGFNYLWSTGQTTQSITIYYGGTYMVTVSNNTGASAVSSAFNVVIQAKPKALITASGLMSICPPAILTLTASSSKTYLWSNGATTQSIVVTQPGVYMVTVSNNKGCTTVSLPAVVTSGNCNQVCPAPYNLGFTNLTSNSIRIYWDENFIADSIRYVYTNLTTNVSQTGMVSGGLPDMANLYSLTPNTNYRWFLNAKCGNTFSGSSDTAYFKTLPLYGTRIMESSGQLASLFPNPASEKINIHFEHAQIKECQIEIKNLLGELVYQSNGLLKNGGDEISIDINKLASGFYVIELSNADFLEHIKFEKH